MNAADNTLYVEPGNEAQIFAYLGSGWMYSRIAIRAVSSKTVYKTPRAKSRTISQLGHVDPSQKLSACTTYYPVQALLA